MNSQEWDSWSRKMWANIRNRLAQANKKNKGVLLNPEEVEFLDHTWPTAAEAEDRPPVE